MAEYKGYHIEETLRGFEVYSSYIAWVQGEEPLYTASLPAGAIDWIDQKESGQLKRTYTPLELSNIARIFYETAGKETTTIYTPTGPLYGRWEELTQPVRDKAIEELRVRIEREGLLSYLERKRLAAGDRLTDSMIRQLQTEGYLPVR